MLTFKVKSEDCAIKLARFWKQTYAIDVKVENKEAYFELSCDENRDFNPWWRESNEAFVAGFKARDREI